MIVSRPTSRILFLLVGLQLLQVAESSTAFAVHSDPTCTNGLSLTNVQMLCDDEKSGGSSTCSLGDTAHVTGTLSIPDTGLFGNSMTTQACLYGFYPCRELATNDDFCNTFELVSYGCPTSGEFALEKTIQLPGDKGLSLGSGWYVVITSTITNDDGTSYVCKVRIDAVNNGSTGGAYLIGMSCVVLLGMTTAFIARKRKLRARINLTAEDRLGGFELMGDGTVRV